MWNYKIAMATFHGTSQCQDGDEVLKYHEWRIIGVRAGGARGAAAPPNFGQLRFFGQREKIWAKPVYKDVSILFKYFKDLDINLKSA